MPSTPTADRHPTTPGTSAAGGPAPGRRPRTAPSTCTVTELFPGSSLGWLEATAIGAAQILALLPGISRSGATMAIGLLRGLSHEDAARFAFLLATLVIAAASVLKLPELAGPEGHGVLGQVAAGSLVAGVAAYLSLRFLARSS